MAKQNEDLLLHKLTRHTNLEMPFSNYVSIDNFPEQNKSMIGSTITLKYRNMYFVDIEDYEGPDKYDPHEIYKSDCTVLRFDNTEPFRIIAISKNYEILLVGDSRTYNTAVLQYPIQLSEFIGIVCKDQYPGDIREYDSIPLRIDNGEPCYSVIVELLENDKRRIVLGDECFTKITYPITDYREKSKEEIINLRKIVLNVEGIK